MGLILRTSHEPMPTGSTISNSRLTIEQMDNNFIYLQNISTNAIEITHSDAIDLINTNSVLKNKNYVITDCDPSLYGDESPFNFGSGTNVIVQGLDTKTFTSLGYGKFYNPKYYNPNTDEGYNVWNSNLTYNLQDIVIYGGRVWRMTTYTENWGSIDYFNLHSDWTPLSYENTNYYNVVWDEVEYDIQDNYISSRYDVYNNNFVKNNYRTQYFYCSAYPIQAFRWGHRVDMGGLADCTVNNSFFGCLNYPGGLDSSIYNITLENQSTIYDLQLYSNSNFYNINLNNSYIGSLEFEDTEIYNILLENESYFGNMMVSNSNIYNISLNNSNFSNMGLLNSEFYNIALSNSNFGNGGFENSGVYDIEITNSSNSSNFDIYSSTFRYLKIENNSYFGNINSSNSTIENINVSNNSNFRNNNLTNASINNVSVEINSYFGNTYLNDNNDSNNSSISHVKITNNSYISNDDDDIYLDNGSYFSNITLDNNSYLTGYMTLVNFSGIQNTTINNNSYIDGSSNIHLINNSYISNIYINNSSNLRGSISLDSSFFENINIDNDSTFGLGVYIDDSYISNIEVSHSSGFGYGVYVQSNSWISNIEVTNDSGFAGWWDNIALYNNSYVGNITVSSNSYVGNISFNFSSYFSNISVIESSTLGNLSLGGSSYISNISLNTNSFLGDYIELTNESYIEYGTINNNSEIYDIIFNSSYLDNFNISGNSNIETSYGLNVLNNSHLRHLLLTSKSTLRNFTLNSSTIEYLNLDHSDFIGLSMSGTSEIIKYKSNNSTLANVNISNDSGLYGVNFNNSYFSGNQTDGIGSFFINGESIVANVILTNVDIPNSESNTGFNLQSGSSFNDSIISNSQLYNIYGYGSSYLGNLTLNNGSSIHNISLTSSNISHSDLNISNINNLNLQNFSLYGLFLKQSNFRNYTTNNNITNNIINLNMNGTYLDLNTISDGLLFNNTDMIYNTIKYQFSYNLAGMIPGQFNLHVLIPGSGWYIEKVIVDNSRTPIVSTGTSFLSLGLLNLNQTYVFGSVDTSTLVGNIKVYDISNGALSGSVSIDIDYLNLNMGGDDIYSGILDFEVILKNTSFSYSND